MNSIRLIADHLYYFVDTAWCGAHSMRLAPVLQVLQVQEAMTGMMGVRVLVLQVQGEAMLVRAAVEMMMVLAVRAHRAAFSVCTYSADVLLDVSVIVGGF